MAASLQAAATLMQPANIGPRKVLSNPKGFGFVSGRNNSNNYLTCFDLPSSSLLVPRVEMEAMKVLHMNAGNGDTSYAQNSLFQKEGQSMAKLVREEALRKLLNFLPAATSLAIADLGCSSGPNTLCVIHELITSICDIRRGESSNDQPFPIDIQVFLNDLPGNDFNTVFKSLSSLHQQLANEIGQAELGGCFVHGVPGSFYGRLFLPRSLHFVHSSYSLHHLSQVPRVVGKSNNGNIYLASSTPPSVVKAYHDQFQTNFSIFLGHRAVELVPGGCMVLTLIGRKSSDPTSNENASYVWRLFSLVLNQMVDEDLIEEEKVDLFNLPQYTPTRTEVETEVEKEGSFGIDSLQELKVSAVDAASGGHYKLVYVGLTNIARAVLEPMMIVHFGEDLMDEMFARFREVVADRIAKGAKFDVLQITVSLTKKET